MAGPTGPAFVISVTHPFLYRRATSVDDAAQQLEHPGAVSLGGGTDLLVTIAEEITRPDLLVDLRTIPDSAGVRTLDDGRVWIGASTRIADIGRDALIVECFPALAQACDVVGTPALRHMGTIGGNLCQRPRCWYFRRGVPCLKNGGPSCPAVHGENQYLAILDGGPCHIVHPSDPAVALTALDATIEIASAGGRREVPISEFYVLPSERVDRETILASSELVSAVLLPREAAGGAQYYHKLMQRDAWDFALVSIAGCKRRDGDVRLVLGGVAPRPWRVNSSVEEDVSSGGLDEDAIGTLADRALYDTKPLSKNGYKVNLAASLLRQTIGELG
ncbi:MAG: carbon monoxide dehydrogenase, FAD-binding subunit [Gemmatimonadetes bacterium]|nr:carbon monoxide dehydrogenase, FAD-binding subunit [Gemmatimonadota bacterium]